MDNHSDCVLVHVHNLHILMAGHWSRASCLQEDLLWLVWLVQLLLLLQEHGLLLLLLLQRRWLLLLQGQLHVLYGGGHVC